MKTKENNIFFKLTQGIFSLDSIFLLIFSLSFLFYVFMDQTLNYRLNNSLLGFIVGLLFIIYSILKTKIYIPLYFGISFLSFIIWEIFITFYSRDISSSIWENILPISFFLLVILVFSILKNTPSKIKSLSIYITFFGSSILLFDFSNLLLSGGLLRGEILSGSFPGHNQFGGFLLLFIPVVLSLLITVKKFLPTVILFILSLISLISLVLTYSRGSWISFAVVLFIFIVLNFFTIKKRWKILTLLSAIILSFILALSYPKIISRQLQTVTLKNSVAPINVSAGTRISVWDDGLKMLYSSPIIGLGPGSFGTILNVYESQPWIYSKNAHNYFLELAIEGGIPAALLFLLTIFFVFKDYLSLKNPTKKLFNLSPLLVGFIAGAFGSLIHAFIDIDFASISLFLLFWVFIGVILAGETKKVIRINEKRIIRILYLLVLFFAVITTFLIISAMSFSSVVKAKTNSEKTNDINTAIMFNPFDEEYYINAALISFDKKDWNTALLQLKKAQQLDKYDSDVYYLLGFIASQKNDIKQAENYSRQAIKLSPFKNPEYYNQLALLFLKEAKTNDAKNVLEEAIFKQFPLNQNFESYKYIYEHTKLTENLQITDFLLMNIYISLNEKGKAEGIKKMIQKIEAK